VDPVFDADFANELAWWEEYLGQHPPGITSPECRRDAFPRFILPYLPEVVRAGRKARVIELGSGPVSLLAWGVEQRLLQITAVDPLAREYARLRRRHGIEYPVVCRRGFGERLRLLVRLRSFDLAFSSNAIDHAQSPARCVESLVSVLKPGGLLVLEGYWNEGSGENWVGLHQHDLYPEAGHLMRRGRDGAVSSLTARLPVSYVEERTVPFYERGIRSFGYEWDRPDGGREPWYDRPWYSLVFRKRG
jgi:SAM-dependent methyltransferase